MNEDITYCQRLALKITEDFYTLDIEAVEKLLHTNFDYMRLFLNNQFEFGCIDRNVCVLKTEVAQEVRLRKISEEIEVLTRKLKHPIYWFPFYFSKKKKLKSRLQDLNESVSYIRQHLEPTLIRGKLKSTKLGLANIFAHLFDFKNQESVFLEAIEKYYQQKIENTLGGDFFSQ
ncbi:hypothetical protein BKI52_44180 [marine bacterium AO1-C]|nr:hypothetical protein BKI52_44180 [marine bacterium AO1-C]